MSHLILYTQNLFLEEVQLKITLLYTEHFID